MDLPTPGRFSIMIAISDGIHYSAVQVDRRLLENKRGTLRDVLEFLDGDLAKRASGKQSIGEAIKRMYDWRYRRQDPEKQE